MNSAKPPIYRSTKSKITSKPPTDSQSTLRRNLSIPNVDKLKIDLGVPKIVLERSSSLSHLSNIKNVTLSTKSLSASNILALSDPNLSLQEAKPKRFYDSPSNEYAKEKIEYTAYSQMYFYQLTKGCHNKDCKNKFCRSNKTNVLIRFNNSEHMAIMFSTELAKNGDKFLCKGCKRKARQFPKSILNQDNKDELPLGCLLITTSPFRSLFQPCPMVSSEFYEDIKAQQRSVSHGNLKLDAQNKESVRAEGILNGISTLTNSLSSSISQLWKSSKESPKRHSKEPHDDFDGACSNNTESIDDYGIFGYETYVCNNEGLEEFETAVASEMNQDKTRNIQELSLTHLTLEMIERIFQDYEQCGDSSFIINTLRTVFTSQESLNESFLIEDAYTSNPSDCELDRKSLQVAFKIITNYSSDFMSTIIDSISLLLSGYGTAVTNVNGVNQFIIIMELPFFFDLNLPYSIAQIFRNLPMELRMQLIQKLSFYDASGFQRLLKGFQSLLSNHIKDKMVSDEHILSFCNVIGILYEANGLQNNTAKIISEVDFYNKKLSKCLDVKKEYDHWQNVIHSANDSRHGFNTRSWHFSNSEIHASILQFPFLLQPETKVQIIHYEAINEMRKEYQAAIVHQARIQTIERVAVGTTDATSYSNEVWSAMCPYLILEIRRDYLIEDALLQLQGKLADVKKPLKIKYIGGGEQGLDMGGLQKEFFQLGMEKLFDPAYDMFIQCGETKNVWFNSKSCEPDDVFELTGMILGLAIYNGIILDVPLPDVMYAKLKGDKTTLKHLYGIEPTVARSLEDLLEYEGNLEEDMCLDFQITETYKDSLETHDLLPRGNNVMVTKKNRNLYVDLYVNYLLNEKIKKQFTAFSTGFFNVCDGDAVSLFRADELELLICGSPHINFNELENVTTYGDGYSENDMIIKWFWSVVNNFTHEQKKRLLSFVTGSDRVPLTGLGSISFIIQRNGPDTDNLPTSMTCFNRLLLPEYISSRKLKEKLLIAIENGKGFGLT